MLDRITSRWAYAPLDVESMSRSERIDALAEGRVEIHEYNPRPPAPPVGDVLEMLSDEVLGKLIALTGMGEGPHMWRLPPSSDFPEGRLMKPACRGNGRLLLVVPKTGHEPEFAPVLQVALQRPGERGKLGVLVGLVEGTRDVSEHPVEILSPTYLDQVAYVGQATDPEFEGIKFGTY